MVLTIRIFRQQRLDRQVSEATRPCTFAGIEPLGKPVYDHPHDNVDDDDDSDVDGDIDGDGVSDGDQNGIKSIIFFLKKMTIRVEPKHIFIFF